MRTHDLAQLNVARLHHPIDAPENAEFVAALPVINGLAEASEGFVWRLVDESGQSSTYVQAFADPHEVLNLSVWESVEALRAFAYRSGHVDYLRRKVEWFEPPGRTTHIVCWWVPIGHEPTVEESLERLEDLRANGPSVRAFPLSAPAEIPG